MIGKKINQLATELAPVSTDLTIIGDPISGVSKKITLAQLGAIFSGAVSFYDDLASFPATGDINVIYCAKDTQKLYLWSGSAYTEVFPSQALLDTYQLRSEKGVSNGYASLDVNGKVPISQLPSSLMEYLGTWNAATNTPTLANGTGDNGDVYLCNVAGTVNFGDGPITFAVGDWVIYNGTIWERSSGSVGTVTSVGLSITGDSIGVSNSPVTTSGTLALAFAGTSAQYINGAGNLTTFPTLTGYVPYTGATSNVDLGTHTLLAKDLVINHSSGSGVAASITKGGNGEALTVVKSSGSGNAASITGGVTLLDELHLNTDLADTYIASASNWNAAYNDKINSAAVTGTTTKTLTLTQQDGGTITASWTDDNTDAVTSVFGRTGAVVATSGDYNTSQVTENTNLYFTNARAIASTLTGYTSGAGTITSSDTILSAIQKLNGNIGALTTGVSSVNGLTGAVTLTTSNIAEGTNLYYTEARVSANTNVAANTAARHNAVTIGTANGLSLSTQVLSLALASGSTTGALSSTDWTTFNNKQSALTNPVTGTGTTNYLPKFTGASTIGNSQVFDDGVVGISNTTPSSYYNSQLVVGNDSASFGSITMATTATGLNSIFFSRSSSGAGRYRGSISYVQSDDSINFRNNGDALRMTISASGNLGLGVTPSAWSAYTAIQVTTGGAFYAYQYPYEQIGVVNNGYFNGSGWIYTNTGSKASRYHQYDGQHLFYTAPSGTAGNAISFTQAMTLNASGNLSIGNTNDTYKLDVSGTGRFSDAVTIRSSSVSSGGSAINAYGFDGAADLYTTRQENPYNAALYLHNNPISGQGYGTGILFRAKSDTINSRVQGNIYTTWTTATDASRTSKMVFSTTNSGTTSDKLTIEGTGAATFSSSVTAGSSVTATGGFYIPNGTYYYAKRSTGGADINVLGFASGSDTLTIKGGTSGASNSINFEDTGGIIASFYNGRLGIGTTSPIYKFEVSDGTRTGVFNPNSALDGFFIGTYQAKPLIFGTGDTERMRITSDGNLLLGLTSDFGYLLSVNGTSYIQGAALFGSNVTIGAAAAGTNRQLVINGVVNKAGRIHFQESGVDKWLIGNGAANETGNFEIYASSGAGIFEINKTTFAATFSSSIKTGAPGLGSAGAIKLGQVFGGTAFGVGGYIPIDIDGTTYYINLATTTP